MALTSRVKNSINNWLALANLRIETLTAERAEIDRLLTLDCAGHFLDEVVPILPQIARCDPRPLLKALEEYRESTNRFATATEDGKFSFSNNCFTSPDAEVAYAVVRLLRSKRIVEIGSGNSTHLFRQAITDGRLDTKLVSIDPSPRREVESAADQVIPRRLECVLRRS